MILRLLVAVVAFLFLGGAPSVWASERIALVIGNDQYDNIPALANARNDAQEVGARLERLGFDVISVMDGDRRAMNVGFSAFESRLKPGATALLFYAGHGVEIDGDNYLLPTDILKPGPGQQNLVKDDSISFSRWLLRMKATGAQLSIAFLDACRDNPFATAGTRGIGATRGLARIAAPSGTFVMYSAGAGELALDQLSDTDPHPNSVYTRTLLPMLEEPGLTLRDMAVRIRRDVHTLAASVSHRQTPAYYDETLNDFSFVAAPATSDLGEALSLRQLANDYIDTERVGTRAAWQGFVDRHGGDRDNPYVLLAMAALGRMEEPAPQSSETPVASAAPVHLCDKLAANPYDPRRVAEGTRYSQLEAGGAAAAMAACEDAMAAHPREDRFKFQYARALDASGAYEDAFPILTELSQRRYTAATHLLAFAYRDGQGTDQDEAVALALYSEAAADDYAPSFHIIGWMHQNGRGVARDYQAAMRWFRRAADKGYARSMTSIGWLYRNGYGVDQDFAEAMRWYREAADRGNALAMNNIGWHHRIGLGVAEDPQVAREWFEQAAARGNARAMHNIADLYLEGVGVDVDPATAAHWFLRSIRRGNTGTLNDLTDNAASYPNTMWAAVQSVLKDAELYDGDVDGVFGRRTRDALRKYHDG